MENSITGADREMVWQVMSEFFVDNEIDYDYWAGKIAHFPLTILKEIYFHEVAPVCGPNVLTPVPPIWLTFDTELVINEIRKNLSRRNQSTMYRLRYNINVLYYRAACHSFWVPVERAIIRSRDKKNETGEQAPR
jgi:hypothetical protein